MKITTLLTTRYVTALFLLAAMNVLGFFAAEYYIHHATSTPEQIREAARLATLSQVIRGDALQMALATRPDERQRWQRNLQRNLQQFNAVFGVLAEPADQHTAQELRAGLRSDLATVKPEATALLRLASNLADVPLNASPVSGADDPRIRSLTAVATTFLRKVDRVVYRIEQDTVLHLKFQEELDAVFLVGNLIMLLMLGVFMIRPMLTRVQRSSEEVMAANAQLNRKVHELEESRRALQDNEELFRSIAASAQDPLVMVAPDGGICFWNPSAEQVFGYSGPEAVGTPFDRLICRDTAGTELIGALNALLAEGRGAEPAPLLLVTGVRRSGDSFPAEISMSAVPLKGQWYAIGVARDVSEHRSKEAQLLRLATAVEQAEESIIITDREGAIQFVNPAFEKLTGYSREEALGRTPKLINSGKHDAAFYARMWSTILAGRTWRGRMVNRRKDGTLFEEDASISPVRDASGQILNFIAVKRDVTGQVQLEAQLRQSQKLEAIGTLVGGIAHDFNNALTPILGYSELLLERLPKGSKEGEYLDRVCTAGRRARDLVAQILLFSRRTEVARNRMMLQPLVKETVKLLRSSLPVTVSIELEVPDRLPMVVADATQLSTVLMNLCINASHAMPDGGTIDLSLEEVERELVDGDGRKLSGRFVHLQVRDTGVGMDEAVRSRIFEPFFTTKEAGKGTGLGLSTVYGIVRQHEGVIQVTSEPGRGSTFDVFLPAWTEDCVVDTAAGMPATAVSGVNVLVVDDEPDIARVASGMLESWGCKVSAFTDSEAALEAFRGNSAAYDVVVSDWVMPGMVGGRLLEAMRSIRSDLPAVIMTGNSEALLTQSSANGRRTVLLQKPFSGHELGRSLANALKTAREAGAAD